MTRLTLPTPSEALLDLDTSGWPAWAAAIWPDAVKWGLVVASIGVIWLIGSLIKFLILFAGRRLTPKDQPFEGTSWDLAASTGRFFACILLMPLPLGLAGYDWRGLVEKYGPGAFAACVILVAAFIIANTISRSLRRHRSLFDQPTVRTVDYAAGFVQSGALA